MHILSQKYKFWWTGPQLVKPLFITLTYGSRTVNRTDSLYQTINGLVGNVVWGESLTVAAWEFLGLNRRYYLDIIYQHKSSSMYHLDHHQVIFIVKSLLDLDHHWIITRSSSSSLLPLSQSNGAISSLFSS